MAPKTNKAQHYVPRCYLSAWCDPATPDRQKPYIWRFDRDGKNHRCRAPKNVFTETDIYTIAREDGQRDLRLERGLSELEQRFAKIRRNKLDQRLTLNPDDCAYLAAFVAAAQIRTPSARAHHGGQWKRILAMMDDMVKKIESSTPAQKKALSSASDNSRGDRSLSYEQVRRLAETPLQTILGPFICAATPILMKMNRLILYTSDPVGFITTDCPVTWFDPEAYKMSPIYRSSALGSRSIEVTMPLSPHQCLVYTWGGPTGYANASAPALHELNRRHRGHCDQHFVSRSSTVNDYWFHEFDTPNDAWEK